MSNFNGMPYKRSGHVGGRSVSMIGMLVFLLSALLVLPSCFDNDTETVTQTQCHDGTTVDPGDTCPPPSDPSEQCGSDTEWNAETMECESTVQTTECGRGTMLDQGSGECVRDYDEVAEGTCKDDNPDNRHRSGDGDDMVMGTAGKDCIDGGKGKDRILGGDQDDDIKGEAGDDTLMGGAGDDTLDGGAGDDDLQGGAGNDELIGGTGDNTLNGGDDTDIAIYYVMGATNNPINVHINLEEDVASVQHTEASGSSGSRIGRTSDSGTGEDTLVSIENVKGTHGNDFIDGDGNANLLKGLDGEDVINGHGGDDTIIPNRPAGMNDDGESVSNAAADATPAGTDGADMVDGGDHGDKGDTISYEGESAAVTIDLGTIVPAEGGTTPDDPTDDVDAHVAATVSGVTDMIKVVENAATEDEDDQVSTIENVTGGFGDDDIDGDDRANTLTGGDGADTLTGDGGADTLTGDGGADTLEGGPGDDSYMGVEAGDTVTEAETNGGMDTVYYLTLVDNEGTDTTDESVVTDTTPANVEMVFGTPNVDNLTASTVADTEVMILGLGGNDVLIGAAGKDTLVGCAGKDMLTGNDGDDVFGIFNDSDDPDTITDFTTGTGTAATDEIHLKGFASGTAEPRLIPGNSTQAGVYVGADLVAMVGSTAIVGITIAGDNPDTTAVETDYTSTQAQQILSALRKNNAMGNPIVRRVEFDSAKCM